MIRRILAAFVLSSLLTSPAMAGILVEPYLGYYSQAVTATFGDGVGGGLLSGQDLKIDASGLGFGLRLGYSFAMAFAAVDYSTGTFKSAVKEQPAIANTTTSDMTATNLGVTAGVSLPMVRPYLGYIFDSQIKGDPYSYSGSGIKIGLGFSVIPMVAINAEYIMMSYTKQKDSAGTETAMGQAAMFKDYKSSGFMVGVSAPFDF
jgi:hypothetical protein